MLLHYPVTALVGDRTPNPALPAPIHPVGENIHGGQDVWESDEGRSRRGHIPLRRPASPALNTFKGE